MKDFLQKIKYSQSKAERQFISYDAYKKLNFNEYDLIVKLCVWKDNEQTGGNCAECAKVLNIPKKYIKQIQTI